MADHATPNLLDAFHATCVAAGVPQTRVGWPRVQPPRVEESGMRIGALVDADGNLLRLVQNPETPLSD